MLGEDGEIRVEGGDGEAGGTLEGWEERGSRVAGGEMSSRENGKGGRSEFVEQREVGGVGESCELEAKLTGLCSRYMQLPWRVAESADICPTESFFQMHQE